MFYYHEDQSPSKSKDKEQVLVARYSGGVRLPRAPCYQEDVDEDHQINNKVNIEEQLLDKAMKKKQSGVELKSQLLLQPPVRVERAQEDEHLVEMVEPKEYDALTLHVMARTSNQLPRIQLVRMAIPEIAIQINEKAECAGKD